MYDYIISGCSVADLAASHFAERDICYTCYHYSINGVEYPDDLGQTIPFEDFYKAMLEGAETKTSQVNAAEYIAYFEKLLKDGKDIIHITLSSGLSGSYLSACAARQTLAEQYPDRKITVIDSLGASSGYGLLLDKCADLRDSGMGYDELCDWVEKNKLNLHHLFFSTDLTFYVKGGRVSKTAGAIGGMLGICPLLNMDNNGHLVPREKIRPKKKVIRRIVDVMKEHAIGGTEYNGKCYISHSACYDDARAVADIIKAEIPNIDGEIIINSIGTTIGSHTGPGTVALFYWGDTRVD